MGVFNSALSVLVLRLSIQIFPKTSYIVLSLSCFPLVAMMGHFLQRRIVWRSTGPYFVEMVRFLLAQFSAMLWMLFGLWLLHNHFKFPILLGQITSIAIVNLVNILVLKGWVFKKKRVQGAK